MIKKKDRAPSSNCSYYLVIYHFTFVDQNEKEHVIADWAGSPNYFDKTKNATILFNPSRPEKAQALDLISGAPLTILDKEVKVENIYNALNILQEIARTGR